jgi:hypothetical protein
MAMSNPRITVVGKMAAYIGASRERQAFPGKASVPDTRKCGRGTTARGEI